MGLLNGYSLFIYICNAVLPHGSFPVTIAKPCGVKERKEWKQTEENDVTDEERGTVMNFKGRSVEGEGKRGGGRDKLAGDKRRLVTWRSDADLQVQNKLYRYFCL